MNIIEIHDQKIWNTFITQHGPKSGAFLQSWEWGEFQQAINRKIWRLGILENDVLISGVLIIKYSLPLGKSYLYCPRGPIVGSKYQVSSIKYKEILENFLQEIEKNAKTENVIFLKIEPPVENLESRISNLESQKVKSVQPERTLILDLKKSEEELLAEMHPKTRYNIRVAERHGVSIHRTRLTDPEMSKNDFEIFWNLLSKTAGRDGFRAHPKNYYWQILNNLAPKPSDSPIPNVALYLAKYQNKTLAANLMMYFADTATYLHGASSGEHRNVMAPYLLHWHIIKEAKRLGCKFYDFWGIDEVKWPGVTRFKKGFGGQELSYPGTFDLPFQKNWYKIYSLVKKLKT